MRLSKLPLERHRERNLTLFHVVDDLDIRKFLLVKAASTFFTLHAKEGQSFILFEFGVAAAGRRVESVLFDGCRIDFVVDCTDVIFIVRLITQFCHDILLVGVLTLELNKHLEHLALVESLVGVHLLRFEQHEDVHI